MNLPSWADTGQISFRILIRSFVPKLRKIDVTALFNQMQFQTLDIEAVALML